MFLQNRVTWSGTTATTIWQRWIISRQTVFIFSWTENFVVQKRQWGLAYKDHVEWWLVRLKRFYSSSNHWALEFSDSIGERIGETFATIDDLIEHYLENRIHLRNGHEVVLRSPLRVLRFDSQPPSSELWYAFREEILTLYSSLSSPCYSSFKVPRNSAWQRCRTAS